jgi:hypothetical protein
MGPARHRLTSHTVIAIDEIRTNSAIGPVAPTGADIYPVSYPLESTRGVAVASATSASSAT